MHFWLGTFHKKKGRHMAIKVEGKRDGGGGGESYLSTNTSYKTISYTCTSDE